MSASVEPPGEPEVNISRPRLFSSSLNGFLFNKQMTRKKEMPIQRPRDPRTGIKHKILNEDSLWTAIGEAPPEIGEKHGLKSDKKGQLYII